MDDPLHNAFAHCRSVSMQVFTGTVPFSNHSSVTAVMTIIQGGRPQRPTHPTFTENLWSLMQRCWDQDPHLRPQVTEVLQILLTSSVARSSGSYTPTDCVAMQ